MPNNSVPAADTGLAINDCSWTDLESEICDLLDMARVTRIVLDDVQAQEIPDDTPEGFVTLRLNKVQSEALDYSMFRLLHMTSDLRNRYYAIVDGRKLAGGEEELEAGWQRAALCRCGGHRLFGGRLLAACARERSGDAARPIIHVSSIENGLPVKCLGELAVCVDPVGRLGGCMTSQTVGLIIYRRGDHPLRTCQAASHAKQGHALKSACRVRIRWSRHGQSIEVYR
jgi:hypothetical protein